MGRAVVMACLPWLGLLLASIAAAWLLAHLSGARLRLSRLWALHRDQGGAVQSLAFVLVLPFFTMIMLFIIQVSQLMIGTVVVHYAAYAAARAAVVWIPARIPGEYLPANCIGLRRVDPDAPDQVFPVLDPADPRFGPADGGLTYIIEPGGLKYEKILSAAVFACMPICPSRDLGIGDEPSGPYQPMLDAYQAMSADGGANPRIPARLRTKLAYSMEATSVEVRVYHSNREPPLVWYDQEPYNKNYDQFRDDEIGWQDHVTVTVHHAYALLPGPGRFLAKSEPPPEGRDEVADQIRNVGEDAGGRGLYVYPLSATATLGNEGLEPSVRYDQLIY